MNCKAFFFLSLFLSHPVIDAGEDSLKEGELGVNPEEEQHEEEHHGDYVINLAQTSSTPNCLYTKETDGDGSCIKDTVQPVAECVEATGSSTFAINLDALSENFHKCTFTN